MFRFLRFCLLPLILPLGLAACAPVGGDPLPAPMPHPRPAPGAACGAERFQGLIGTAARDSDFQGHQPLRIIPPGTAVTMDYNPTRLNVEIDATGIITRISCG